MCIQRSIPRGRIVHRAIRRETIQVNTFGGGSFYGVDSISFGLVLDVVEIWMRFRVIWKEAFVVSMPRMPFRADARCIFLVIFALIGKMVLRDKMMPSLRFAAAALAFPAIVGNQHASFGLHTII